MDTGIIIIIGLVLLLLFLFMGMWAGAASGLVAIIGIYYVMGSKGLAAMPSVLWNMFDSFLLSAAPLFMFMGLILTESGLASRIYSGIQPLLDHFPGGLLHSNVVVGTLLSGASGAAVATTAAIGTIAVPEMEKRGYDVPFALGSVAAGGLLDPLIPPSLMMILYGAITSQSIGQLFMAGVVPGLMLAVMFMTLIATMVKIKPQLAPRGPTVPWGVAILKTVNIWPIIFLVIIVLGSIYGGIATPTEAAGVGSVGALLLALIYRTLSWKGLIKTMTTTLRLTGMLGLLLAGCKLLQVPLANMGAAKYIGDITIGAGMPSFWVLMVIYLIFLVMGLFMSGLAMLLIFVPVVFPLAMSAGYDPIWFGLVITVLCEIGSLTPPVGVTLFILQGLQPGRSFSDVVKGCFPFCCVTALLLAILTAFPQIALWLPSTMVK